MLSSLILILFMFFVKFTIFYAYCSFASGLFLTCLQNSLDIQCVTFYHRLQFFQF